MERYAIFDEIFGDSIIAATPAACDLFSVPILYITQHGLEIQCSVALICATVSQSHTLILH